VGFFFAGGGRGNCCPGGGQCPSGLFFLFFGEKPRGRASKTLMPANLCPKNFFAIFFLVGFGQKAGLFGFRGRLFLFRFRIFSFIHQGPASKGGRQGKKTGGKHSAGALSGAPRSPLRLKNHTKHPTKTEKRRGPRLPPLGWGGRVFWWGGVGGPGWPLLYWGPKPVGGPGGGGGGGGGVTTKKGGFWEGWGLTQKTAGTCFLPGGRGVGGDFLLINRGSKKTFVPAPCPRKTNFAGGWGGHAGAQTMMGKKLGAHQRAGGKNTGCALVFFFSLIRYFFQSKKKKRSRAGLNKRGFFHGNWPGGTSLSGGAPPNPVSGGGRGVRGGGGTPPVTGSGLQKARKKLPPYVSRSRGGEKKKPWPRGHHLNLRRKLGGPTLRSPKTGGGGGARVGFTFLVWLKTGAGGGPPPGGGGPGGESGGLCLGMGGGAADFGGGGRCSSCFQRCGGKNRVPGGGGGGAPGAGGRRKFPFPTIKKINLGKFGLQKTWLQRISEKTGGNLCCARRCFRAGNRERLLFVQGQGG